MKKMKFGSIILGAALIVSVEAHAYNVEFSANKKEILAGDKVVVSVKLKDLEEEIDTYQGKLSYNRSYFEVVESDDFTMMNKWGELAYNSSNGIFVVERTEKSNKDEEVMTITLETKKDMSDSDVNISLNNNLVSGGKKDISTTNISLDLEVIKQNLEYGYIIEDEIMAKVKPKTPIKDFINIVKNSKDRTVKVYENGKEVTAGYIKTGMTVKITENGNTVEYTISVIGDANGDGYANSLDTKILKAYRNEIISLSGANFRAADINNDGFVDYKDSKLLLYHRAGVNGYDLNYSK